MHALGCCCLEYGDHTFFCRLCLQKWAWSPHCNQYEKLQKFTSPQRKEISTCNQNNSSQLDKGPPSLRFRQVQTSSFYAVGIAIMCLGKNDILIKYKIFKFLFLSRRFIHKSEIWVIYVRRPVLSNSQSKRLIFRNSWQGSPNFVILTPVCGEFHLGGRRPPKIISSFRGHQMV